MRTVRVIPHSSSEPVYCGVPAPLWYDVTAGVFPNEVLGGQLYDDVGYRFTRAPLVGLPPGNIIVNALPADEILCSTPEDGRVIAGLKDSDNYIELVATQEQEPWLDAFSAAEFPYGSLPGFELPPVPFPELDFFFGLHPTQGYIYSSRAAWTKLELAHVKDGSRRVLSWRLVPRLPEDRLYLQSFRASCVRNSDGLARIVACVADVIAPAQGGGLAGNLYFLEGRVPSSDVGPFCGARSHIAHFRTLPEEECVFVSESNKPPPPGQAFGNELLCEKFVLTNVQRDYQITPYDGSYADYVGIQGLEATFGETPLRTSYLAKPALYYGAPLSKKVLTAYSDDWPSWSAIQQTARPNLTIEFKSYDSAYVADRVTEWEMIPSEVNVSILNNANPIFDGDSEKHIDTLFSGQWTNHSSNGRLSTLWPSDRGTIVTSGFIYLRIRPLMASQQGKSIYPFKWNTAPQWKFPHDWRNAVMMTLTVFVHFRRNPEVYGASGSYRIYQGEAGWECVTSQPYFASGSDVFGFLPDPVLDPPGTGLYWREGAMPTGDDGVLRMNQGSPRVVYKSLYTVSNGTLTGPFPWQRTTVPPFLSYVRDMYWNIKPN